MAVDLLTMIAVAELDSEFVDLGSKIHKICQMT